ncbi:uncharacterized protein LOC128724102 [Anopheles nili]|uniref:uncharacterized protein LOC128724102 n=1 Tax=Anopheles nili TaxID=185578 RepID=UPI00237AF84D|nr:uncharacterized protein LOC128724102 [Anopheles nili]
MNLTPVFVVAIVLGSSAASPLLAFGNQDGGGLLGKVANFKQTVYEKKRELLNGINEKVSKMLWIPPFPSTTTEQPSVDLASPQQDPVSETVPNIWWWQTTPEPPSTSPITIDLPVFTPAIVTTSRPATSTRRSQVNNDQLVFTVADTDNLELPNVFMYARSGFIPKELLLTDSVEYLEPVYGRGPPAAPRHFNDQLIVL